MVSVLFVCLGNICRSPTAEGVFTVLCHREGLGDVVRIDSAGTAAYHVGAPPDERAQAAALRRGIDLSQQRARQVAAPDFDRFDYVLAMDASNLSGLREIAPPVSRASVRLCLDFAPDQPLREVPDPYYGAGDGFEQVLDLVETASAGLIDDIRRRLATR
ncbi:MAG: protein-tyrosine phosphatase [Halieaceae bacterium]|jgi:protein-tyrosine phosphatase